MSISCPGRALTPSLFSQLLMFVVTFGMQSLESSKWLYETRRPGSLAESANIFAKNYQCEWAEEFGTVTNAMNVQICFWKLEM